MYSTEEIQKRIDAYMDAGSDMEETLRACINNHKTLTASTNALETARNVILYGAETSSEEINRIETIMFQVCDIMDRRKERAAKLIQKIRRHLEQIESLAQQVDLPVQLSGALGSLVEKLVGIHLSHHPDLSNLLQTIQACQEKLRDLQDYCKDFPPEVLRIFIELQNLLFNDYHFYQKEQIERNQQEELLTPDLRELLAKMERMPPELRQLLIDICWLAGENNKLTNPIADAVNKLNSTDEIEKLNERTEKALDGKYTNEEVEMLFADIDAFMPFISELTDSGKAIEEATGRQIEKIKTMTAALHYYAGES